MTFQDEPEYCGSWLGQALLFVACIAFLTLLDVQPRAASAQSSCSKSCSSTSARQIQSQLKFLAYYDGKIDGRCGPATRKALSAFQRDQGLNVDGCISGSMVIALQEAARQRQLNAEQERQKALASGATAAFGQFQVRDEENNYRVKSLQPDKNVLLLHFWATNCPECVHELPSLANFMKQEDYKAYQDLGVAVIPISEDFDVPTVKSFLRRYLKAVAKDFPILLDTRSEVLRTLLQSRDFQLPQTIAVDGQTGEILAHQKGAIDWANPAQVKEFIANAMQKARS